MYQLVANRSCVNVFVEFGYIFHQMILENVLKVYHCHDQLSHTSY